MSEPDRPLKDMIITFLTDRGLSVEEIAVTPNKTPDLRINGQLPDETLLEIKSKEDDPEFMAANIPSWSLGTPLPTANQLITGIALMQ